MLTCAVHQYAMFFLQFAHWTTVKIQRKGVVISSVNQQQQQQINITIAKCNQHFDMLIYAKVFQNSHSKECAIQD